MTDELLRVEVAYARPERQRIVELHVPAGSTVREAAVRSGLQQQFPELDLQSCPVGVFGVSVADAHRVQDGDRVEIYRPLINEPREARRQRAADGKTMGPSARR